MMSRVCCRTRIYLGEVDAERGGFFDDIWFECQAENLAHAVEQAKDAYPGCLINPNDWTGTCQIRVQ